MKKLSILIILFALILGCYRNISQVERKWGPPAKVEDKGETIHYFWCFYHTKVKGSLVNANKISGTGITAGTLVVEIITDRNGKVLDKRKYWKQPELK